MAEWREVPGFDGNFLASSDGRVAKVYGYAYAKGYCYVNVLPSMGHNPDLIRNLTPTVRSGWNVPIHRVIAITFIGPPPDGKTDINHKDGNKKNNRPENLEWSSRGDNVEHARRTGLHKDPLRKYTERQYKQARVMRAAGSKWKEIAQALNMTIGAAHHAAVRSQRGRSEYRPWREAE